MWSAPFKASFYSQFQVIFQSVIAKFVLLPNQSSEMNAFSRQGKALPSEVRNQIIEK